MEARLQYEWGNICHQDITVIKARDKSPTLFKLYVERALTMCRGMGVEVDGNCICSLEFVGDQVG